MKAAFFVTASQRAAHLARKERQARIAAAAERLASKPPPPPVIEAIPAPPRHATTYQPASRLRWANQHGRGQQDPSDPPPAINRPKVAYIQQLVAGAYGYSVNELCNQSRLAILVHVRFIAIGLAKKHTLHSMPELGRRFGNRDHTSILNAVKKFRERRYMDDDRVRELDAHLTALSAPVSSDTQMPEVAAETGTSDPQLSVVVRRTEAEPETGAVSS